MKQFIAGSIIDNISDAFENNSSKKEAFKKLAHWGSHFQINSKTGFEANKTVYTPTISVLINFLQRGLPTKLNQFALEEIVKSSSLLKFEIENDVSIKLKFNEKNEEISDLVFRSLHFIDSRLNRNNLKKSYLQSWEKLGSNFEENFLFESLPNSLGEAIKNNGDFIIQLLAPQRKINNIIPENLKGKFLLQNVRNNFEEQKTDFSIEFPYTADNKPRGIVIEVDGKQHQNTDQIYLDIERDRAITNCGWNNTLRINTTEFGTQQFGNKIKNIFTLAINNEYVKNQLVNYIKPLWNSKNGNEVMQLCLIPMAISRIQRIFLEAIAHDRLSINQKEWKIAVIERDVPCAKLAIDDLLKLVEHLNGLLADGDQLIFPQIELEVYNTKEFKDSSFQKINAKDLSEFDTKKIYDLIIDISILEKSQNPNVEFINSNESISIRSIHYIETTRAVATADLISYKSFCTKSKETGLWSVEDDKIKEDLEYLIQSLFRKKTFWEGQLPIINQALQCKSVIGLLPTGGGKSLTYQFSALLQPGICLVIDPIRSLMKDQVDGLLRSNIDSCVFINSTLQGEEKRKALSKMTEGNVQFVFISPERLQMEEFRRKLEDMYKEGFYFSYCVIDEAHCVSEWGHDFRTAYLRLGENAIKYCKTKNLKFLPLFGLTATASYDVLADVQRELSGNEESLKLNEDAIIRSEFTKRHELQYIIEEVTFPTGLINNIWDLKRELGNKKQERVKRLLNDVPGTIQKILNNPLSVFNKNDWELNEKNETPMTDFRHTRA